MSSVSSGEVAAAEAGAEVERVDAGPPAQVSGHTFDSAAVDAARAALPGWDVQAEGITRTVTPAHPAKLQVAAREIAVRLGRVPELTAHDGQIVIRLAAASGSLDQLVELAGASEGEAALDPAASGS